MFVKRGFDITEQIYSLERKLSFRVHFHCRQCGFPLHQHQQKVSALMFNRWGIRLILVSEQFSCHSWPFRHFSFFHPQPPPPQKTYFGGDPQIFFSLVN